MDLKILEQKENKLLNRKEMRVLIDNHGGTPKREDIAAKLSATLNTDKNLVVVQQINQKFGAQKCLTHIKVYHSLEDLQKTEPKPKEKKTKTAPAEQAPAAPQKAA